jgi:subtilisin family serine protease
MDCVFMAQLNDSLTFIRQHGSMMITFYTINRPVFPLTWPARNGKRSSRTHKLSGANARSISAVSRVALLLLLSLSPAFAASRLSSAEQYVEGEAIVTFRQSVDLGVAQRVLKNHSLQFNKHFGPLSQERNRQSGLVRASGRTTSQLIAELAADPEIEIAEPNFLRWISSSAPDDPLFPKLWALQNTGQSVNGATGAAGADIKFVSAWGMAQMSTPSVVVAVIDTGVDYTHPDLGPSMWINPGEIAANSVDDDGNGYADDVFGYDMAGNDSDPYDSGYHGTHVSGTIAAAGNNLLGVIGVGYPARIMALKASTDGESFTSAAIIEAIQYATLMKTRGVNVVAINASFGGGGSNSTERAAIKAAGNAGIVFCAAAGNSGLDHDVTADYPSSYRLSNMIVVAASTQSDGLASFSDYGATTVDLAAPGVNILSTAPSVVSSYVTSGSTTYTAESLLFSGYTSGVTGTLHDCGLGYPADFPAAVSNNIALISRGTLYFSEKVANAIAAGARAAIIYNNVSGSFSGTLRYASNWVPAVALSQSDGEALKALLPVVGTVVNAVDPVQSYQFLNGTSMATPHVTAATAFAAMCFPAETVSQRIQRILGNVDTLTALQGKVRTGGRLNLLRIVDTDANNLPDWWERTYFGRLLATAATADPDGDGASDLAEWVAGTNPTNAASCLRLNISPPISTNGLIISWPSVAGKTYRIERTTNLLAGFKTLVRSNITATPPTNHERDTSALGSSAQYFYRVGVDP